MTISKEAKPEREIPLEEVPVKVSEEETEAFIRTQIEAAREGTERFPRRTLAIIEDGKATLTATRRKDDPRILEKKWTEADTFLQVLNGVMGGGEPSPSWIIRTFEGTKEIFPSWKLTEEEYQVFFVKSSHISLVEKRVTSTNWSVVAWRRPKRFQFLRDLFG